MPSTSLFWLGRSRARQPRSKAVVDRPVRVAPEPRWDDDLNDAALKSLSAPGTCSWLAEDPADQRRLSCGCAMAWIKLRPPPAEGVILTNNRDARMAFRLSKDDAEAVGNCPALFIEGLYKKPGQLFSTVPSKSSPRSLRSSSPTENKGRGVRQALATCFHSSFPRPNCVAGWKKDSTLQ